MTETSETGAASQARKTSETSAASDRRTIIPAALRGVYDAWHFAPAVVVNGLIFCSGIVGTSPGGETPALRGPDHDNQDNDDIDDIDVVDTGAEGGGGFAGATTTLASVGAPLAALQAVRDPQAQFATAFEALRDVLGEAGARLADIVELTSYHVEISRHMQLFMHVKDRYLQAPYPAWTAIGVTELIVPGGIVELRAVALDPS